jgi:hypothetical protein
MAHLSRVHIAAGNIAGMSLLYDSSALARVPWREYATIARDDGIITRQAEKSAQSHSQII